MRAGVTVQSIDPSDGSLAGDIMARNYQPRVDGVSRAAQWNCLRFEQPLTLMRASAASFFTSSVVAILGTVSRSQPFEELNFADDRNAECLCLSELTARIFAGDDK